MDKVACPHCGHLHDTSDWVEYGGHDGDSFDIECYECEEDFSCTTTVTITYEVI